MRINARVLCLVLILLLFLTPSISQAQTSISLHIVSVDTQEGSDHLTLSVYFTLVDDATGKPISESPAKTAKITDIDTNNSVTANIDKAQNPLFIGLLLDTSSSMAGKKLNNAKGSLGQLLKRLNKGDEAMLMTFDARPLVVQSFTQDLDRIKRAIRRLEGNGSTALYDAILMGLKESESAQNRRRVLLLLSDGVNTYGTAELKGTISQLRRSAAELFAIGLETDLLEEMQYKPITETVLDQLTSSAGGESFIVAESKELGKVCDEISERMHNQYTFAYYPPKTNDGQWRSIRIETKVSGYTVVASKTGYYPATDVLR